MPATKPLIATCLMLAMGYLSYPYVTLYRLGEALHSGDAQALKGFVNWPAVRDGIKRDISDRPNAAVGKGELPGFGAAFASGLATQAVDRRVTPEGLVRATHETGRTRGEDASMQVTSMQVNWAFFDSPTQFMVSLKAPGQAEPIRLQMRLHDAEWRVDRVWLPQNLLDVANART